MQPVDGGTLCLNARYLFVDNRRRVESAGKGIASSRLLAGRDRDQMKMRSLIKSWRYCRRNENKYAVICRVCVDRMLGNRTSQCCYCSKLRVSNHRSGGAQPKLKVPSCLKFNTTR
jgi:hypothetical protein